MEMGQLYIRFSLYVALKIFLSYCDDLNGLKPNRRLDSDLIHAVPTLLEFYDIIFLIEMPVKA